MKKLFLITALILGFPLLAFGGFPSISSDSWHKADPTYDVLYSSQMSFVYDAENEDLLVWNGHVESGGYPQSEGVFRFDLDNYTGSAWTTAWSLDRPYNESPFKV